MWRLSLSVQSRSNTDTMSLAACLATDCDVRWNGEEQFIITLEEATCKDLRAMWNTRLRGLIATDSVLKVFESILEPRPPLGVGESMEQLDQLQLVVAEVQAARQQVSSVRAQVQELEGTIAAVASQPEGMALHRQMGGVLIEVADRDALMKELKETLESLAVHLERFTEREKQLIQTYDELKQSLQGAQE